jgi:hypothetical protein
MVTHCTTIHRLPVVVYIMYAYLRRLRSTRRAALATSPSARTMGHNSRVHILVSHKVMSLQTLLEVLDATYV